MLANASNRSEKKGWSEEEEEEEEEGVKKEKGGGIHGGFKTPKKAFNNEDGLVAVVIELDGGRGAVK